MLINNLQSLSNLECNDEQCKKPFYSCADTLLLHMQPNKRANEKRRLTALRRPPDIKRHVLLRADTVEKLDKIEACFSAEKQRILNLSQH